jgi:hypothetical protein
MKKSSDFKSGCDGSHHFVFEFWDLKVKVLYDLFVEKDTFVIMGPLGIEK